MERGARECTVAGVPLRQGEASLGAGDGRLCNCTRSGNGDEEKAKLALVVSAAKAIWG